MLLLEGGMVGSAWVTVSGRFVRVVEGHGEPTEVYDFVHRRPDVWSFDAPDSPARLVAAHGLVGLRHPDGWTARLPGTILADRVEALLTYDPTKQPVLLQLLDHVEINARRVRRLRWQRTDRDLSGELMWDEATGIVHRWANDEGRSEHIEQLVIDGDVDDPAGDALLVNTPTQQKVGAVDIHRRGDQVRASWHVSVPGLPAVKARPPEFASLDDAAEWATEHAHTVSVDPRLQPPPANDP